MRARFVAVLTLVALLALPSQVGQATSDPIQAAEGLGLTCVPVTSADGVKYTRCEGEIASEDGIGLDTTLSLPMKGDEPYPTLLMLHGWSGHKGNWQASTTEGDNPDEWHWNNVWFVQKGYAVVNYTARGFHESCGMQDDLDGEAVECRRGWTHLSERDFEI